MRELILEIAVACQEAHTVKGHSRQVTMIPFTGQAEGPLFHGRILGGGVDTQIFDANGCGGLSARYMLEGVDAAGTPCRIFIQNQGNSREGFVPWVVTDSPLLASWETEPLSATVDGAPGGVTVRIYRKI